MKKYIYGSDCSRFKVLLPDEVKEIIFKLCSDAGKNETGGILIGSYNKDHTTAFISEASEPTQDTKAGRNWLIRGIKGLARKLQELWHQKQIYLGEWHFHPGPVPEPSRTDDSSMSDIVNSKSYKCPEPILLLIWLKEDNSMYIEAYVYNKNKGRIILTPETDQENNHVG